MPVDQVGIHHEGAGDPTDDPRGAHGGYCAWIGPTRYTLLRPPEQSTGTGGWNHRIFDACISGNREHHDLTDREIELLHEAFEAAHALGWVSAAPNVDPHATLAAARGKTTACPGARTLARWPEIVAACRHVEEAPAPVPPEPVLEVPLTTVPSPQKPQSTFPHATPLLRPDDKGRVLLSGGATVPGDKPWEDPKLGGGPGCRSYRHPKALYRDDNGVEQLRQLVDISPLEIGADGFPIGFAEIRLDPDGTRRAYRTLWATGPA